MNITELKRKKMPEAWFTFDTKTGVELKLGYLSPADYAKRLESCSEVINGNTRLNQEKVREAMAELILDWRGMTLGKVAELVTIDIPEGQEQTAVPCTKENKLAILADAWGFKEFVNETVTKLVEFITAEREERRKNSLPSLNGSSAEA
jgi:hypothetical protein